MPDNSNLSQLTRPNILVAPMNWGLGHAARCIPIVQELLRHGYNPIIASDGAALQLLRLEFPELSWLELPSYNIAYARNPRFFNWKLLWQMRHILDAVGEEHDTVKKWVKKHRLAGIISDNRFGVYSKKVPSVFMTHQLNVVAGSASWFAGRLHRIIIKKFTECWVPDYEDEPSLSGKLGHVKNPGFRVRYLGALSRFVPHKAEQKFELMVLLSGPEPQRTMLEEILISELASYIGRILFVKGIIEDEHHIEIKGHFTFCNYMISAQLQQAIAESGMIVCRSGYTTVMDLAVMNKKAFFIPTPGQYEQEYLANKLQQEGIVPFVRQDRFRMRHLTKAELFSGLTHRKDPVDWQQLFRLFKRE